MSVQVPAMNSKLNSSFFRETVQESAVGEEKIIRQHGGISVYAHVRVEIRALSRGQGTIFTWDAGLNIPTKFVHDVLHGIQHAMTKGTSTGLELTDVCISVEGGSYHEEDSTADAFREAAEKATREATLHARPMILEALSSVTITVPEDFVTAVQATVKSHDGNAGAAQSETQSRTLAASLPSSNLNDLIAELLRISNGHARISSCNAGFRPRLEPPDDIEQWVART
jgi:elongation factor G